MTHDGQRGAFSGTDRDPAGDAAARRASPDRVAAFSDGVFAIIITILVLEISVPPNLSEQSLREALDEVGATFLAWVISFLITGMYWVWHRDVFNLVRRVNRDLVWLNLLFLLPVALIPFAASVLGEYHDDPTALRLYGAVLIVASVMRMVMFWYLARRPQLLWDRPGARDRRIGLSLAAAPIAVYVVAMAIAEAAQGLSLALYLALPLLYFTLITVLRTRPSTRHGADDFS